MSKKENELNIETANLLKVPGLMLTVSSPSQTKIWKEKRDSYKLRHNTPDVLNDNIVIEIPSSRRASFHGHSLDLLEPTSRPVSPCMRWNSVDQQDDARRRGSIEMKEYGGSPVVDTQ